MKIQKIKLLNFRNYDNLELEFNPCKNIIIGRNGSGKTNIVEAIYVLAGNELEDTNFKNDVKELLCSKELYLISKEKVNFNTDSIDSNSLLSVAEKIIPTSIIEDTSNMVVFPTTSPLSKDCAWISLNRVKKFEKIDSNNTKIIFDNNKEIIIDCSYRSIENQISRASRLDFILRKHKNKINS